MVTNFNICTLMTSSLSRRQLNQIQLLHVGYLEFMIVLLPELVLGGYSLPLAQGSMSYQNL